MVFQRQRVMRCINDIITFPMKASVVLSQSTFLISKHLSYQIQKASQTSLVTLHFLIDQKECLASSGYIWSGVEYLFSSVLTELTWSYSGDDLPDQSLYHNLLNIFLIQMRCTSKSIGSWESFVFHIHIHIHAHIHVYLHAKSVFRYFPHNLSLTFFYLLPY